MKKYLIIFAFFICSLFFIDNVNATTIFDTLEDKYYIVHKWVGNSSSTGNNAYYVGIYNNYPTIENDTIYDSENITYYKILTRYNLFQFLNTGDISFVDTTTTTKNSMMLNSDSSNMMYANFDLYRNGSLYFAKKEYSPLSAPDNIGNYYNITSFYDSDINSYKDENYYILKSSLDSMMYDDIEEWASTSNDYSSTSLNTIKNNLLNGNYDSYIENYGPYYITYNATTYNANKICFFRNYDDIYLQRTHSDNNYNFDIYLKNAYCLSYEKSSSSELYEFNNKLQSFVYIYTDLFNNVLSLTGSKYTIYYSDEKVMKGLLGNEVNTLKLKNSFNSGTNAYGMSKVIWNINASTDSQAVDGTINFKIQYGANDFTNANIPIFNNYKIYGYNEFESGWTDITDDERFYFDDFNYEYYTLEGTATETILTSTLNIPSDMCVYEQIKVEFYFDNTNNFYMYVFDDLISSTWDDLQYYFENYTYYEFPTDQKYAFITHKENNKNVGKLYVPYNDIINPDSLFGAYIYDLQYKSVSRKLQEMPFEEHDYYYYYDFEFSFDNNEVLLLQRKTGTNESVGFYLPSDYIVEFANSDENITILTPNGYIDIDSGKVENVFSNDSKSFVDYLNVVRNYISNIGSYITSFFDVITYFLNGLPGEVLTAIITIFIVLCACVIVNLIRK